MLRVNSRAVVLVLTAVTDVLPATLLFLEIQTSGVGEEDVGQDHACKTKPGNHIELGLRVDVVVQN